MECPLCGAHIPEGKQRCQLCDTLVSLEKTASTPDYTVIDTVDVTKPKLCRRKLTIFICVLGLMALPWLLMADLFMVPTEVQASRDAFDQILDNYRKDKSLWQKQKNQVLLSMRPKSLSEEISKEKLCFDQVPLETLIAFFEEDLSFTKSQLNKVKLFPTNNLHSSTFLISKVQKGVWPLHIMLSLEVKLSYEEGKLEVQFKRLRRGTRDISPKLAWIYFGPELDAFRQLENLAGGIIHPRVYSTLSDEATSACQLRLSWQYQSPTPF